MCRGGKLLSGQQREADTLGISFSGLYLGYTGNVELESTWTVCCGGWAATTASAGFHFLCEDSAVRLDPEVLPACA